MAEKGSQEGTLGLSELNATLDYMLPTGGDGNDAVVCLEKRWAMHIRYCSRDL